MTLEFALKNDGVVSKISAEPLQDGSGAMMDVDQAGAAATGEDQAATDLVRVIMIPASFIQV